MVKVQTQGCLITLSESRVVNVPADAAYRMLFEPAELLKWNTNFLLAKPEPEGDIRSGTILKSSTKSTGKTIIVCEEVLPGKRFTYNSAVKIMCLIPLGTQRHKYEVEGLGERSKITQTISFIPKGLGKIFKRSITNGFRKIIADSFDDFRVYAEQKMQHQQ